MISVLKRRHINKFSTKTSCLNTLYSYFANVVLESNENSTLRAIVCFKLKSLIPLFVILYNRKQRKSEPYQDVTTDLYVC